MWRGLSTDGTNMGSVAIIWKDFVEICIRVRWVFFIGVGRGSHGWDWTRRSRVRWIACGPPTIFCITSRCFQIADAAGDQNPENPREALSPSVSTEHQGGSKLHLFLLEFYQNISLPFLFSVLLVKLSIKFWYDDFLDLLFNYATKKYCMTRSHVAFHWTVEGRYIKSWSKMWWVWRMKLKVRRVCNGVKCNLCT